MKRAARSTRLIQGKVGLALSGGGFRAALFHVGVLARLAELRVLPRVDVISTVSGGSIVGAAYYLLLKNRVEDVSKGPMADGDYVQLVRDLEGRLLGAVRKNIRGRVFANPFQTVRMAWPSYSRSDRIGDLYDRHLYKGIWKERPGGSRERRWRGLGPERQIAMHELQIEPRVEWGRREPPILWINATSLNSGHNWRFGTLRMGEPRPGSQHKGAIVEDVDKNMRLEPGFFERSEVDPWVGGRQEHFPLALAVAASACVPLLFHPLSISGMYRGIRVELVDGGVQDNQGIQGLLDERCEYLIVSDASGQMGDVDKPATILPSVGGRTMSIQGDRIRDEQLSHARADGHTMALLHLRKGLAGRTEAPIESPASPSPERLGEFPSSAFGVHGDVQEALSRIRTDLDYFGDSEAFSLMLDGYLMTDRELMEPELESLRPPAAPDGDPRAWDFGTELQGRMASAPGGWYARQLRAGGRRFLRTLAIFRPRRGWAAGTLALVGVAAAAAVVWRAGAIGDAVGEGWRGRWPASTVIVAAGAPLLLLLAYAATAIQWPPIRYPIAVLWGLGAVVPAVVMSAWRWLALPWRHLAMKLGRVPR